ncbi:MAG: agmatine deiminase family protein [Planctomycetota bacterium]
MKPLLAILQAALAAAAVHAVVLALRGDSRPPAAALLDERAGRIAAVEVQFAPTAEFVSRTWIEFFRELPAGVKVYVAVEKIEHFEMFSKLTGRAATPVVTGRPITTWARDRFITGAAGAIIVPPETHSAGPARSNDRLVPYELARVLGVPVRVAPFRFDGGDFTRAYGRIFCSSAWAARNPELPLDQLLAMAESLFGEPVVYLPGAPNHHVGMIFAPVGDNMFAVGDVRKGVPLAPAGLDVDDSEETAAKFDTVAAAIEKAGFKVVRVPVVVTKRDFVWMTFTNGVFSDKTVYLPVYGEAALDAAGIDAFRSLGFEVKAVNVAATYGHGGTLHCLVHVLKRD